MSGQPAHGSRPGARSLVLVVVALAATLGLVLPASAATAATSGTAAATGTATVSGVVTDSVTGRPVVGATVVDADTGSPSTVTDGSGRWALTLTSGTHRVQARATAYSPKVWADSTGNQSITLADSQVRSGVDIALVPYGSVSGKVTALLGGAPVPGVVVKLFPSTATSPAGAPVAMATSGTDGIVTLSAPAGSYKILYDAADTTYRTQWWRNAWAIEDAAAVVVGPGAIVTGRDVALAQGARITGVVRDPAGAPIAGVEVSLEGASWNGNETSRATTDSAGTYRLGDTPAGTYLVQLRRPGVSTWTCSVCAGSPTTFPSLTVTTGQSLTRDYTLPRGATISGTVTLSTPPATSSVTLLDLAGRARGGGIVQSDGRWSIGAIPPGTYQLRADGRINGQEVTASWLGSTGGSTSIVLGEGDVLTGFALTLPQPSGTPTPTTTTTTAPTLSATLTGVVTSSSGPVAGVTVSAQCDGGVERSTRSASDGRVTLAVPATYCGVMVVNPYTGEWAGWKRPIAAEPAWAETTIWWPQAGQATDMGRFTLVRPATVSGIVTTTAGAPLAGVTVGIMTASGGSVSLPWRTGPDGRYQIQVPPGQYVVKFGHQFASGYAETWWGGTTRATATVLDVGEGETRSGVSAFLAPDATLSGRVVDTSGAPVADARVTVRHTGAQDLFIVNAAADGTFAVDGLPPASYLVSVERSYWEPETRLWWPAAATAVEATPVVLAPGEHRALGSFTLGGKTGDSVPTLAGVVTDGAGAPVAGATVTLVDRAAIGTQPVETVRTDAQGRYELRRAGADLAVRFDPPAGSTLAGEWWVDARSKDLATRVDLSLGRTLRASAVLTPGATVSGEVRGPGGAAATSGTVDVVDPSGNGVVYASATIGSDGRYVVRGLRRGTYHVRATATPWVTRWWGDTDTRAGATALTVTDGQQVTGVTFTLRAGGVIAGTLRDKQTGAPLPSRRVTMATTISPEAVVTVTTDDTGRYVAPGLPAGPNAVGVALDDTAVVWHNGSAT